MKLNTNWLTEKRLLWGMIGVLIATTLLDMFSALRLPIFSIAESNPIYLLTGNVFPLIIMNIVVILWMWNNLNKKLSLQKIFVYSMLTLYLSVGHGFGIYSNLNAQQQYEAEPEEFIEYAQSFSTEEKISAYVVIVGLIMFMPIVISIIAFNIAMYFYGKRAPKRDKIILQIHRLSKKVVEG